MRLSFVLLVFLLLAGITWALWEDAFPEWRRYQRELHRREIVRLEAELEDARTGLLLPEVSAELSRLDALLAAHDADSTAAQREETRARLAAVQTEVDELRHAVREADRSRQDPATVERREEVERELERISDEYAAATGTWPPDTLRLEQLWAERDSVAEILVAIEGPAHELRAQLEEKRAEAQELRVDAVKLGAARDSIAARRDRFTEPVTSREAAVQRLRGRRLRIREIASADGREVARCPTCHGTLDDPPGVHPPLPATEEFLDVPCTICHRGNGRALDVEGAHENLLTAAGFGAGKHSLRARIERLLGDDPAERRHAREELRLLTGSDPAAPDADVAAAEDWAEWWRTAEAYFEPTDATNGAEDEQALLAIGIDPWIFSARGRPLRYVGSRKCLGCHEVQHREHSRRWLETKSRSIERLVDVEDRRSCFPCHATGWDAVTETYAEPGVTCEGCHGPGERYDEMMAVGQELIGQGDETRGRALLDHASRLAREAVSRRTVSGDAGPINVCVGCHHPRRHQDVGPGILEREKAEVPVEEEP